MSKAGNARVQGRWFHTLALGGHRVYAGRRKVATAVAAVLALAFGYHVIFGHNGLIVYKQKRDETQVLDEQLQQLRQENDRLKEHTARLQSDPTAIEHQAREELHYTRPGEVIYTMPATQRPAGQPQK